MGYSWPPAMTTFSISGTARRWGRTGRLPKSRRNSFDPRDRFASPRAYRIIGPSAFTAQKPGRKRLPIEYVLFSLLLVEVRKGRPNHAFGWHASRPARDKHGLLGRLSARRYWAGKGLKSLPRLMKGN